MGRYHESLKHPKWQKRRLEIFERDGWRCRACKSDKKTLAVHHLEYSSGYREPWDYPDGKLITLCEQCHQKTHKDPSLLVDDFADHLKRMVLSGAISPHEIFDLYDLIGDLPEGVETNHKEVRPPKKQNAVTMPSGLEGVPSGFSQIDNIVCGFRPDHLTVIASRPVMGKTFLSAGIAMNVAVQHKIPVCIFSTDHSREQLLARMIQTKAEIPPLVIGSDQMTDRQLERCRLAADLLLRAPIFICDAMPLPTKHLFGEAIKLKKEKGIGLLIVDSMDFIRSSSPLTGISRFTYGDMTSEITEVSMALKVLAQELNIPVVVTATTKGDHIFRRLDLRPIFSDLPGSGAVGGGIEAAADTIVFLHREEVYNRDPESPYRGIAEVNVAKNPNGPTGIAKLGFNRDFGLFYNLAGDGGLA